MPYISHIGTCCPKGFGLKKGIDFAYFGLESGMLFEGNYGSLRTYLLFQFQVSKKEREITQFEMDFKKST